MLVELGAQNLYSVLAILVYAAEIQQIIIIIENMRISQLLLEITFFPMSYTNRYACNSSIVVTIVSQSPQFQVCLPTSNCFKNVVFQRVYKSRLFDCQHSAILDVVIHNTYNSNSIINILWCLVN